MKPTSAQTVSVASRGISSATALTITLVVLKALGYITWAWIWVFSPIWIPYAVLLVIGLVLLLVLGVLTIIDNYDKRRKRKKREELRKKQGIKARP